MNHSPSRNSLTAQGQGPTDKCMESIPPVPNPDVFDLARAEGAPGTLANPQAPLSELARVKALFSAAPRGAKREVVGMAQVRAIVAVIGGGE